MFDIIYFDSIESTMDIARERGASDADEGLLIQAGEQINGRGRRGNQWTSPKGNLYQSILLRPRVLSHHWGQLSFVIAVALGQAMEKCGGQNVALKWPNDVLIEDRKIAGILIEIGEGFAIIGTGVNIAHCPDERAKLHDFSKVGRDEFRDIFLQEVELYYNIWQENGFAPIRQKWLEKAYRRGEMIQARTSQKSYEGVFEDLDHDGTLLLRLKNGEVQKIISGEILNVSGS